MEAVIFSGIQASGKSSFYKERFFRTHMRLSLDMLNTRNKEGRFLQTCFDLQQRFVIDNTNPSSNDRENYIRLAKAYRYKVIGYSFSCSVEDALKRNARRSGKEFIEEIGIRSTLKKLEPLRFSEGFDELYTVCLEGDGFTVEMVPHEV